MVWVRINPSHHNCNPDWSLPHGSFIELNNLSGVQFTGSQVLGPNRLTSAFIPPLVGENSVQIYQTYTAANVCFPFDLTFEKNKVHLGFMGEKCLYARPISYICISDC